MLIYFYNKIRHLRAIKARFLSISTLSKLKILDISGYTHYTLLLKKEIVVQDMLPNVIELTRIKEQVVGEARVIMVRGY